MRRFVTTVEELAARPPRHVVVLFSGGVDSTYLLRLLADLPTRVTALRVRVGGGPDAGAAAPAGHFGAAYREVDATDEFFTEFLPAAVHADAYYQGQFPVGSTLTRPLMARAAVRTAAEVGADSIGFAATYMQNTVPRLTRALVALDPDRDVLMPFLGSTLSRAEKLAGLRERGIEMTSGIHSVDVNPWSRVIENGSLENPENDLLESVFTLTRDVRDAEPTPVELTLEFRAGLPVALDGRPYPLGALVDLLNPLAGRHAVGRFSGLEDTPFGVKNHEIRESPAAAVITAGHRALANAVFTAREHTVRTGLAAEWTTTVVQGGWFSLLAGALAQSLAALDRAVTGSVRLRLDHGAITVRRLATDNGLYYSRLGGEFHEWMRSIAHEPWQRVATLADDLRRPPAADPHAPSPIPASPIPASPIPASGAQRP
jgi:argininosuccinate synthase